MECGDDIGIRPAAWSSVPVQSYTCKSCSLNFSYMTLVVGNVVIY